MNFRVGGSNSSRGELPFFDKELPCTILVDSAFSANQLKRKTLGSLARAVLKPSQLQPGGTRRPRQLLLTEGWMDGRMDRWMDGRSTFFFWPISWRLLHNFSYLFQFPKIYGFAHFLEYLQKKIGIFFFSKYFAKIINHFFLEIFFKDFSISRKLLDIFSSLFLVPLEE